MTYRLIGSLALLLAALTVSRGYAAYADRRLREGEELLLLLRHIRAEIAVRLTEARELFAGFSGEVLPATEFFAAVREGESVRDAWERGSRSLSVSAEMKKLLSGYFSELGRDYRDGELAAADRTLEELSRLMATEREELPKSVKLLRLVSVASALGIMLLLI